MNRGAIGTLVAGALWIGAISAAIADEPTAGRGQEAANAGPSPSASTSPGEPGSRAATGVFEKDVVEVGPGASPITHLIIDNRLGDVRVEGHDGDGVVIHAFKRGPDDAALDRLKVSLIPDPQGPVRIGTRLAVSPELAPLPAGSVRIDLVIQAPRGAAVEAVVWNGQLTVVSMDNGANLHVNRGDVAVKNCSGHIVTSIAVGSQQFDEVVGDIDAQGLTGDLDMQVVRGQHLDATVHRGHVVGRQIRTRNVAIRVTDGDISFSGTLIEGGEYHFTTYHGDVEVAFTRGAPVKVAARSRSGDVKLPSALRPASQSDGWVTGEYHHSAAPAIIQMATAIGAVRVASF